MPTVFSANRSSVLVDGSPLEGLQSLVYRVVTEREDIRAVGSNERVDVMFGLRTVRGELVVKSASFSLDGMLDKRQKFQIVATLKRTEGSDETRTASFDDCFVEGKAFQLDAHGSAVTTYAFSATRLREE
jgi:hypothetical protein